MKCLHHSFAVEVWDVGSAVEHDQFSQCFQGRSHVSVDLHRRSVIVPGSTKSNIRIFPDP
jgi:hypothetical protein